MFQKTSSVVAAALTAFLLMVAGPLVTQVAQEATTAPTSTGLRGAAQNGGGTASVPASAPTPELSTVKAAIAEREAAYQTLLQEANREIQNANAQLQKQAKDFEQSQAQVKAAQARLAAAQPAAMPTPPKHAFASEHAAQIALRAVPDTRLLRAPELVSFQGKAAYEIQLDKGLVYVDADSGQILHNAVVRPPIAAGGGGGGSGAGGNPPAEGRGEHEEEHQHDEHPEREHDGHGEHEEEHDDD